MVTKVSSHITRFRYELALGIIGMYHELESTLGKCALYTVSLYYIYIPTVISYTQSHVQCNHAVYERPTALCTEFLTLSEHHFLSRRPFKKPCGWWMKAVLVLIRSVTCFQQEWNTTHMCKTLVKM